jgi:hypothetical protein
MATIGTTVTTAAAKYNCKQKRLLLANLVGCNIYISAGAKAAHGLLTCPKEQHTLHGDGDDDECTDISLQSSYCARLIYSA